MSEDEFKPLRLMNGLYLQLHGYMLRVALPYGVLSASQVRQLAYVARYYDRGYGHFTTRQNIQFNWPRLTDTLDILAVLAEADLHAIQTSGNCVRNVTTDHFAGAAVEEVVDPRLYAEILRQWSTDYPEFTYLPRKFKIAITGARRTTLRFAYMTLEFSPRAMLPANRVSRFMRAVVSGGRRSSTCCDMSSRSCVFITRSAAATTSTRRASKSSSAR